jgi:RNA polymerase sigma-70 factor, ECF subfamily
VQDQSDMTLQCGNQTDEVSLAASDAKLVALAKAGNDEAYAELVNTSSPIAIHAVRRILRAEADVEDALQEALIRSYFKLSTFDGRAKFSTWFTRIAINCAFMIRRKHKNIFDVTGEPEKNELLLIADPRPGPLNLLRAKQESEVLRHAIDSLPCSLKECLQIRLNDDLSLNELATRLHLSLSATKTRLSRAKQLVIASAATRLMPTVCAGGKTENVTSVPSGKAIRGETLGR